MRHVSSLYAHRPYPLLICRATLFLDAYLFCELIVVCQAAHACLNATYLLSMKLVVCQTARTCLNATYLLPMKLVVFIEGNYVCFSFLVLHWQPLCSLKKGLLQVVPSRLSSFRHLVMQLFSVVFDELQYQLQFLLDEQTAFFTPPILTSVTVSGSYTFPEYIVR